MTVTVLRGRTSDRSPDGVRGSELLGAALGGDVRVVGEPSPPAVAGLGGGPAPRRDRVLEAAAAAVAGPAPVLVAAQCTIALATLPVIAAREPDAVVVWLDAHGDFNTPATSGSGYLGGMPLAAACGLWDGGYGAGLDASRVVLGDARDLDPAERAALDRAGVRRVALADVAGAVRGERVFLHLDLDVLDPQVMAAAVPAPGGADAGGARRGAARPGRRGDRDRRGDHRVRRSGARAAGGPAGGGDPARAARVVGARRAVQ